MAEVYKQWQIPPYSAAEDKKIGWLNEATEEGQNWLRAQRGFGDFQKAMDIISGRTDFPDLTEYRSKMSTNRLKRNVREVIGAMADIRPVWGYASDSNAFKTYADMMNKVSRSLYLTNFYDTSIKEALQFAAATCTGWVRPVYRRGMAGHGRGKIQLMTYGSPCVLPVQLPSSGDWQEAYAVTLMDEMPIYMAHSYFPDYQDRLHPTESKYWHSQEIRKSAAGNMWKRLFSGRFAGNPDNSLSDLYIPIRYTTVIDNTVNTTDQMIPMGEPGSSWYYEVQPRGAMIPDGYNSQGIKTFREATQNDARLYPHRRLIISSESVVLYDGPCFNWHGQLDLIPFCLDQWPWESIGYSLVRDGYDIQSSINELIRGMQDKYRAQLDLPLAYDLNAVTKLEAEQFDPMQPRARIAFDGQMVQKPFDTPVPADVYMVRPELVAQVQYLEGVMDYQMAVRDVVALSKAKAIGKGSDNLEALLEAQGPIVKDMSRSIERPLGMIGQQLKYLILQYMTSFEVMQLVGENGVALETFDYDPSSLVPSHLPGEKTTDSWERPLGSQHSAIERARWFADNLRFFIAPHSIHEITQMQYRLMLLQMRQRNIPIDARTIAEACDVPNFGTKPEGDTVYERFRNEKEDEILFAIRMQKIAQEAGTDMNLAPPQANGPRAGGSTKKGGRPPSGQAAPTLQQKGDGRPTIAES